MEGSWSDGQIELFHALGKICERMGREGADELLREGSNGEGLNAFDGRAFVLELRELRKRACLADGLETENRRLRAELNAALGHLDTKSGNDRGTYRTSSTHTAPEVAWDGDEARYECLVEKHNVLVVNHQELVRAREILEDKLRSNHRSRQEWIDYADALEKRIIRREGELIEHGIPLKRRFEASLAAKRTSIAPSSSRELVPVKTADAGLETLRRELPNLLHMSERISKLARNAAVETSGYTSSDLPQPIPIDGSEQQQEVLESDDALLPSLKGTSQLRLDSIASDLQVSRVAPKLLMDVAATPKHNPAHHVSSASHHSSTTEEDLDVLPNILSHDQADMALQLIKAELSSDTPIVTSSRCVRKRKNRSDTVLNESTPYTKVKLEIVTSSPIGLAGLRNLFPQESMDLDEIGEKMNTPKKRRQVVQSLNPYNGRTKTSEIEVQSDGSHGAAGVITTVGLRRGHITAQSIGRTSVLQPASPNKQIQPRTSGKKREPKRRLLEDRMQDAAFLAEDGENDMTFKMISETAPTENLRKNLHANAGELERRLTGLLEEPSPEKKVITPARPSNFSAATAQLRARATPVNKYARLAPLVQRQIGAEITPNTHAISRGTPKTDHKTTTGKKRSARTLEDIGNLVADDPDQEPLRARPVHRLGLEHFKVNSSFNQGSDYPFADVVRGREARKCLPGCTKPECCGDKFRKFIDIIRGQEQRTLSQEEDDERLLEDYLGDNKGRLRKIPQREKEELLIQARTRDLANKASKHRHAYERRRSPPGFWRSDFPSTQEVLTDRLEAASRERELVQQRYEEAMRSGGRWLFRDE